MSGRIRLLLSLGMVLGVLVGPASARASLLGEVRWFELVSEDADTASDFYAQLFGWRVERMGVDLHVAWLGGRPIAGISQMQDELALVDESAWVPCIVVRELEPAVERAVELGALVREKPRSREGYGSYAVLEDPWSAPFKLVVPHPRLGGGSGHGAWVWAELWARDLDAAGHFYSKVVGYQQTVAERPDGEYALLGIRGEPRAGMVAIESREIDQAWAPYIGVDDLAETLRLARHFGGRVLLAPHTGLAAGRVALLADPAGGAFFVYQLDRVEP